MRASTHSTIVRGACGCAVVGAVVTVLGIILAINWAKSPEAAGEVRQAAAAALDTLRAAGFPRTTVLDDPDSFALSDPVATEVLRLAGRLWNDSGRTPSPIAYGDTLREGSAARTRWLEAADRPAVDSLLAVRSFAGRTWKVSEDAPGRPAVLYHARAVLARARRAAESGNGSLAEWLLRAVVTVGHEQQSGPPLLRAITGVRLERDALEKLAAILPASRRPAAAAGAARADSLLGRLLETRRLLRTIARDAERLDTLVAWAHDSTLPIPLRDDCVRAIGAGWIDAEAELVGGVVARRAELLAGLQDSLPEVLGPAVRAARDLAALAMVQRLAFAAAYQDMVEPLVEP
ncbi:MAG: hypothetical protein ACREMF_03850 [Gemmatimonadales bacterium]